jgi:hypothetical protein
MPPQPEALPLVVKSLFGVSGGVASRTSLATIGERGPLSTPGEWHHQPRKGVSFGKTERMIPWPSWS